MNIKTPMSYAFSNIRRAVLIKDLGHSFLLASILFFGILLAAQVYASTVTLAVVVTTSLAFTSTTNNFTSIQPGTPTFATTTLLVTTNDTQGWNVTLSGDNANNTNDNLQLGTPPATSTQIVDLPDWIPAAATTSAGNAIRIASFTNSGNVLAFRVMTASSTNGTPFFASTWWGTTDAYVDNINTLWSGIASSTVLRRIGNAGTGSYTASTHINTVLYYLNVSPSQPTGTYTAPITYTATGN